MGIVFHQLCHHVPDDRVKKTQKQRRQQNKHEGRARANLRARRRLQLDILVKESRAWMYAMSLPTSIIANDDNGIQQELDNLNDEVMVALLGTKISNDKILRVTGRIARNILVPDLDNTDHPTMRLYPRAPAAAQMRRLIDNTYVKADIMDEIYKECTGFWQNHPDARTFREVRKVAGSYTFRGSSLRDRLKGWQWIQARNHLGLPYDPCWTDGRRDFIEAQLKSKIPDSLHDMRTLWRTDLIMVIPDKRKSRATASILPFKNIMKLYPKFFEGRQPKSLRDIFLSNGGEEFEDISHCCVRYFLHEITHASGVLETKDHWFPYKPFLIDYIGEYTMMQYQPPKSTAPVRQAIPTREQNIVGYGLEACLALARRDQKYNRAKAENNADSWSFYCMLRMIMLVYPELDIMESVRTPDLFAPTTRHVRRRYNLLHHCTLFESLRHREAGSIRDHPDYDPSKDYFATPNVRRPQTLEEILDHLKAFDINFYGT